MPIASWNVDLSVGVDQLDADHQQLIETMNDVFDALLQGSSASATRQAMLTLTRYVDEHFSREEAWMIANEYPEIERHMDEHRKLRQHIAGLLELQEQSEEQFAVELLVVLRDWLLGHISKSDRAAAPNR